MCALFTGRAFQEVNMVDLYHKDFGFFSSDCDNMIDRKLAMGYKFLDEVEDLKPLIEEKIDAPDKKPKKRGRPTKKQE